MYIEGYIFLSLSLKWFLDNIQDCSWEPMRQQRQNTYLRTQHPGSINIGLFDSQGTIQSSYKPLQTLSYRISSLNLLPYAKPI